MYGILAKQQRAGPFPHQTFSLSPVRKENESKKTILLSFLLSIASVLCLDTQRKKAL